MGSALEVCEYPQTLVNRVSLVGPLDIEVVAVVGDSVPGDVVGEGEVPPGDFVPGKVVVAFDDPVVLADVVVDNDVDISIFMSVFVSPFDEFAALCFASSCDAPAAAK